MNVAITGARGFLGWHTRAALRETEATATAIPLGAAFSVEEAAAAVDRAERVIHIAGVNRADEEEVRTGNVLFAEQLASAVSRAERPPAVIVFANTTQVGNGTVYADAKARAAEILADAAAAANVDFVDLRLPNLFGEHGRPFYNAVTSTFCHLLARDEIPHVQQDKELTLMHAQNAADLLTGRAAASQTAAEQRETVSGLLRRLTGIAETYRSGTIPDLATDFERDLFNTYRSYAFELRPSLPLTRNADPRGSFFEIVRSAGGEGQSSFSTTVPGVTRGDHFHRRKVERFTVLSGSARIRLRRLFSDEIVDLDVTGDEPVAVDMPTMWSHNITNVGEETLFTSFWANELFDPARPDTIPEVV